MKKFLYLLTSFLVIVTLSQSIIQAQTEIKESEDNLVEYLLKSNPEYFKLITDSPEKFEVQILYTQIDRDENNFPNFTTHAYRVDKNEYFYPASTIKLPAAVLALEKLNNLNIDGLNKHTHLKIDSAYSNQKKVEKDETSEDGLPTISHYIKKIFIVSDNDAHNRLYEFLGQKYFNEGFWEKGFTDFKMLHRLSVFNSKEENQYTNPFTFYNDDKVIYEQPLVYNPNEYKNDLPTLLRGKGYIQRGELINEPKDFTYSNYCSIENLQGILKSIMFPEAVPEKQRFNLTEDDYEYLYMCLSVLPRESKFPKYEDEEKYNDSYVKFFMFGDNKERIHENIRIYNKVGLAYGYFIDNAYIVDFDNKTEFLLTAVIYVNENEIFNDDTYEYDKIAFPFFGNLGRVIYDYELQRERKFSPDLSRFVVKEYK